MKSPKIDTMVDLNYTWRIFKHLTAPLGKKHVDPYMLEIVDLLIDYQDVIDLVDSGEGDLPPWYRRRAAIMTKLILHPDFRDDLWTLWVCNDISTAEHAPQIEKYFTDSYKVDAEVARIFTRFACGESYTVLNPFTPPLREIARDAGRDSRDNRAHAVIQIDEDCTAEDIMWALENHMFAARLSIHRKKSATQYSRRDMAIYIMRQRKMNHAQIGERLDRYGIGMANDKVLSPDAIYKIVERLKPKSSAMADVRKQIATESDGVSKENRILTINPENSHFIIEYNMKS